jgi:radical SAM-linked protein
LFRQRLRLRFRVRGDARFLSHHDMMRLWERALRRAGLPIRMSQGYNPRPKLSLPEPRSVGVASEDEILEFELADWVNPDGICDALAGRLPEGVEVAGVELLRPSEKARPIEVAYRAELAEPCPDLADRVARLLERREAPVVRPRPSGDKHLDARPFIASLEADGTAALRMLLVTGPNGTVRPDEVLRLLEFEPEAVARADLVRTGVVLR